MTKKTGAENGKKTYQRMLLEKRAEVLLSLGYKFDTMARMGHVAEEDQAQITHDEFISLSLNSLDYTRLRLIEEALDRLEAGDYGYCLSCEERIPEKRLKAVSWARYCIKCQDTAGAQMDLESGLGNRPTAILAPK